MHLETIQHLRSLAGRHDDLVPIAKPLLLDLLDSYERHELRSLNASVRIVGAASEKHADLKNPALAVNTPPDALNLVILHQLLKADDYDTIEAVKAAAQDYLQSLNACPLDFAHQPHDHCDGTAASQRNSCRPVSESALELVHADMQGHVYGVNVGMNECAADDFLTWYQHFKNHDLGGSRVHEFDIHSVIDIMAEWLKAPFSLDLPLAPRLRTYLIISEERRAYGMVWFYAPKSAGYTVCTARAGRYTEAEAAAILRGTSGELAAILESDLTKLQILHHIDRGYGDNGAILKTLITHVLPSPQPVASPQPPNPAPETFEAHGHTWTRHTPGDPCPVPPDTLVHVLLREELHDPVFCDPKGSKWSWAANIHDRTDEIIGWRYAEPQPSTPAK